MNHQSMPRLSPEELGALHLRALAQGSTATADRLLQEQVARLLPTEREPVQQICPTLKI